jgi:hypothetical protein
MSDEDNVQVPRVLLWQVAGFLTLLKNMGDVRQGNLAEADEILDKIGTALVEAAR